MTVYALMLLISLSGIFFDVNRSIKSKKRYLTIVFGCLIIVAAIRGETVGTDLRQFYSQYYASFASASWENIQNVTISGHWEWGFCALNKLLCYVSTNVQLFIIVTSIISIMPYAIFIYKNSEDVVLSTFFFIAFHVYMISFNIVRQAIAIGIILLGFEELKKKHYVRFALFVLIATSFHTSSMVALLFIIIDKIHFKRSSALWLTLGSLALMASYAVIFEWIIGSTWLSNIYNFYEFNGEHTAGYITYHTLGMFVIALFVVIVTIIYFPFQTLNNDRIPYSKIEKTTKVQRFVIKRKRSDKQNIYWSEDLLVYASYLAALFRMAAFVINVTARMAYFFIPFLFISFPHAMGKISNVKTRRIYECLMYGVLLVFFFYIGYFRAEKLWGAIPYRFFWE